MICEKKWEGNAMLIFQWNKSYETDIDLIDEQHKNLVNLINALGVSIQQNEKISQTELNDIFNKISQYADEHFRDEEGEMEKANVDSRHVNFHKEAHEMFIKESVNLFEGVKNNFISYEVLFHFLSNWLSIHILGTDKVLAKQIKAIQKGQDPQIAYETTYNDTEKDIGPLLFAVNQLFTRTIDMNNKLIALNKSLEEQVKLRTKELEQSNNILKTMALTDALTKLGNRRAAVAYLKNEWKKKYDNNITLTCIMIDADNFKHINDTERHESGDKVLQIVANTIKHSIRNDDFICRLGGDEFVILSNNTNLQYALKLAEHVRKQVEQIKLNFKKHHWHGSISIGVAARDSTMEGYIDLLKKADEGLYIAKRNGRNCVGCAQINTPK